MDIRKLLEDPTGQQVITKRPVGTKIPIGGAGTVKRTAGPSRVVVEFDKDEGVEHVVERVDVELVPPVRKESPPMPPPEELLQEELSVVTPRSPSDDDVDEL